jgi:hypothetical protein
MVCETTREMYKGYANAALGEKESEMVKCLLHPYSLAESPQPQCEACMHVLSGDTEPSLPRDDIGVVNTPWVR